MAIDLSNKKIIMIHGLGSKPPRDVTHALWCKTLIENIRVSHRGLAQHLDTNPQLFESAYWADAVPHHIPDDAGYCRKLAIQVDKVIDERRAARDGFHVGMGEKLGSFFKDRGIDVVKLLAGALTVKDDVMTGLLRETELYDQDQYIADQIRAPLESALRKAWDAGQEPIVLCHSMGSFIGYDVLWRFGHRKTAGFRQYNSRRVRMFVTMGSWVRRSAMPASETCCLRRITRITAGASFRPISSAGTTTPASATWFRIKKTLMKYFTGRCVS